MPPFRYLLVGYLLIFGVLTLFATAWVMTLNARALGYWTQQFEVPYWRGQEDKSALRGAGEVLGFAARPFSTSIPTRIGL